MTILVVLPGLDGTATTHSEFVAKVRPWFDTTVMAYFVSSRYSFQAILLVSMMSTVPGCVVLDELNVIALS